MMFLADAKVYLVLDDAVVPYHRLETVLRQSVKAGIQVVQFRSYRLSDRQVLEFAKRARLICRNKALFIVNNRCDLALAANADGVHLGQNDLPVVEARKMLGPGRVIGVSCQTLAHIRQAHKQGADYIGFGSVFKTQTKPDRRPMDLRMIDQAKRVSKRPIFFIGGITLKNIGKVVSAGGRQVAVTRAICESTNILRTVKHFVEIMRG